MKKKKALTPLIFAFCAIALLVHPVPAKAETDRQELLRVSTWTWLDYDHHGRSVKTQSPQENRDLMTELAQEVQDGLIVELGVFGGASLLHLASVAAKTHTHLVGVDPWGDVEKVNGLPIPAGDRSIPLFMETLEADLRSIIHDFHYSHISLKRKTSLGAVNDFRDASIDLLLVDGSHDFEAVLADLKSFLPKMKAGGTILGDDYDWLSVRSAVDTFVRHHCLELEVRGRLSIIRL